jgi:pimeloyl-ACP methyl ester carboxylesterase
VQERLTELNMPVLVITGDDDRIVATADSIRLASELPNADLVVLENCGHVPQEECPQAFHGMQSDLFYWNQVSSKDFEMAKNVK